ncbi:hypothetical protein M9H77_32347 [Catharanthus roseus]|uniref:Uncharacterized protein n=1 Tax=Catharanthus roseus TaxID=4058 RepID=A0ACC0A4J5_CATRO|nr:hypothetical protein M9H77_32347 [Catharanthus roseus]
MKKLAEFLQEQQDPFTLEVYLLERRRHNSKKNRFHSSEGDDSPNCSTKANKPFLKRSVSWNLKRNRKLIPNCSKVVRTLFSKLQTAKNDHKLEKGRQEIADAHYYSKNEDILLTTDHQESPKDEYVLTENEVAEDWKQLSSPVSVLEETESNNGSSPVEHEAGIEQKHQLKSVSKCKSEKPIYKRTQQVQEFVGSNSISPSSHYSKNKKAVQQTRQLLFDCVREVVEKHKKESEGQQIQGILRPEQLWELICENLYVWSKESINETNITPLVCYDVLASTQEWNDLENQTKEIGSQLGDAILEDIINEITT